MRLVNPVASFALPLLGRGARLEWSLPSGAQSRMAASPPTPQVVVVSDNPETIDGLQGYFVGVGIQACSARSLGSEDAVPAGTTALVVFPDEFPMPEIVEELVALREEQPGLLLLLVTAHPQHFVALSRDGRPAHPIVLPKPVFGWIIVDAIRMHAQGVS